MCVVRKLTYDSFYECMSGEGVCGVGIGVGLCGSRSIVFTVTTMSMLAIPLKNCSCLLKHELSLEDKVPC